MNRRDFLGQAAAFGFLSGCRCFSGDDDGSYSVSILGDTHYDAESATRFHSEFLKKGDRKKTPWCFDEFKRNGAIWSKDGPGRAIIGASARCVTADTRFVLQLGDLVQGDCDTERLHTEMLSEATDVLRQAYGTELPIVGVCGNHDVRRGIGQFDVRKVYRDFSAGSRARELTRLGGEVDSVGNSYVFETGKDAYVVIDFNAPDLAVLERLLARTDGARYVFVCIHGPVLPMGLWRSRFFYMGKVGLTSARRKARALLARRNVIVLAGHEHRLECRDWRGDGGRITEMVFNTIYCDKDIAHPNPSEPEVLGSSPRDFVAGLPDSKEMPNGDLAELYREYLPGLTSYYAARAVGHYRMHVSDEGVFVEYYGHDSTSVTKCFRLR